MCRTNQVKILVLIVLVFILIMSSESFDVYDNHYLQTGRLTGRDPIEMKYFWSDRDKHGLQQYDYMYEDTLYKFPVDESHPLERQDVMAVLSDGRILNLSQKHY